MAVQSSHTTGGALKVEGTALGSVIDMNLNITVATADVTAIAQTWDQVLELGRGWEMSATLNFDPADTAQAALITGFSSGGDCTFTSVTYNYATTGSFSASAVLTSASITKSVGSADKMAVSFKGAASLTYT